MMQRHRLLAAVLLAVSMVTPLVWSDEGGLTSGFGKVRIDNIRPGRTYRISKVYSPITVLNTSEYAVNLKMETMRPAAADLEPEFEPIPSLTWILLEKTTFTVEAFGDVSSDLVLYVPDKPEYWGMKYQLHVWSHTYGGTGMMAVGLMHKLLITTPPLETRSEAANEIPAEPSNFSVEPFEIVLGTVPMHDTISISDWSKKSIVIKNPLDREHRFRLRVLRPDEWEAKQPKGYELCPNTEWLTFEKNELVVPAKGSTRMSMKLRIPAALALRGKRYLVVVRAEMLDGNIPTAVDSRIYFDITTKFKREWLRNP